MKIAACGLAAMLVTVAGLSQAQPGNCGAANVSALRAIEMRYKGTSARLAKADQDRYQSMLAAIKGDATPDCKAQTLKIEQLKQALDNMVMPPVKIGAKAHGGVVYHTTARNTHGQVAAVSDVPVTGGGMTQDAAVQACNQSTAGGKSDWSLPSADELKLLYAQKNVVGGFNYVGRYWTLSKISGKPDNVSWQRFSDGLVGSSDTKRSDALLYARCVRKF